VDAGLQPERGGSVSDGCVQQLSTFARRAGGFHGDEALAGAFDAVERLNHVVVPGDAGQADALVLLNAQAAWGVCRIEHHEGALDMIIDVLINGSDEIVQWMASDMSVTQQTQIGHMEEMLADLT